MGLYSGSELLAPLEVVHKFKPTFYVHKVHTYFVSLPKEHFSVDSSADVHVHTSQEIPETWHNVDFESEL